MNRATLIRRASVAVMAFTFAACSDSTGPKANLTEEQVGDMLDAMSAVSAIGSLTGVGMAIVNASETVDCPNGGSATANATINDNQTAGTATVQLTQSFSGCKATSSSGRVWTFDGDPNIKTNLSMTVNQTTGAFTMTGTQKGGIKVSSELGSGSCAIDLTMTFSGDDNSFSGSLSGSACGHNIQQSIDFTS
jgi:hypothetical protein